MKNTITQIGILTALIIGMATINIYAQTSFWTEDFGTGCDQATYANGVTTSNGTWMVVATGTNDDEANSWFMSGAEAGMGVGSCGDRCTVTPALNNKTLHIGNSDGFGLDDGAIYNAGGICPTFACVITNIRAESPVINCSEYIDITLAIAYMEGGDDTTDNATLNYYDGSTWTEILDMPKTGPTCGAAGIWEGVSVPLPASANNNPNVQIGINWTNNDDAFGIDPSIVVDDITLSGTMAVIGPTAAFSVDTNTICIGECVNFTDMSVDTPTSWIWNFPGASPTSTTAQNPMNICYSTSGSYDVTLIVSNDNGADTLIKPAYVNVIGVAVADFSGSPTTVTTAAGDVTFTDMSTGAQTWSWKFGDTGTDNIQNPVHSYTTVGTYSVRLAVTDSVGCSDILNKEDYITVQDGTGIGANPKIAKDMIMIYPNPFHNNTTLKLTKRMIEDQRLAFVMYNAEGKEITRMEDLQVEQITIKKGNLLPGVYFYKIESQDFIINSGKIVIE